MANQTEILKKGLEEKKKKKRNQFAEGADMQNFKADPAIAAEAKRQAQLDKDLKKK